MDKRKRPPRKPLARKPPLPCRERVGVRVHGIGTKRTYDKCPLCGSAEIQPASESIELHPRGRGVIRLTGKCWSCAACGEKFLTAESRRRLDKALGLTSDG